MANPNVVSLRGADSLREKVSGPEWEARVNLAAAFRVATHLGWNFGNRNHMTLRLPDTPGQFLMNAQNFGWHEITASNLLKIELDTNRILTDTDMTPGPAGLNFHSAILRAKPGLNATLHLHPKHGVVVSAMEEGLQFFDQGGATISGDIRYHDFEGLANEKDEAPVIVEELGDAYIMIMRNHGLLTVGRTLGEGFTYMASLISACETQVLLRSTGSKAKPLSPEICAHTANQIKARSAGRPRGDIEWKMYLRLAEQIDPSFRN
jgi:ribulose-5-phosphate 4-epimerase/fuculose-1-phosphate aldolase